MQFYELLEKVDKKVLLEIMKEIDDENDSFAYLKVLHELKKLTPISPPHFEIIIDRDIEGKDKWFDVYGKNLFIKDGIDENGNSERDTYALELSDWEEWLGFKVNEKEVENIGVNYYVAFVLWEITYLGFESTAPSRKLKELEERVKNIEGELPC